VIAGFDHDRVAEELQGQLRDLLSLAVVGDHARWVLVGEDATEVGEWLADATPQWRALADRVAKRLVAIGVAPDGRLRSLAKDISLHWVPDGWLPADEARRLLADRLRMLADWACYRLSQATDPETETLLDTVCSTLKAQANALAAMIDAYSTQGSGDTDAAPVPDDRGRRRYA
jgi:starvation-inducible DNA-binding protein